MLQSVSGIHCHEKLHGDPLSVRMPQTTKPLKYPAIAQPFT